jgi:THO complex subunit 2
MVGHIKISGSKISSLTGRFLMGMLSNLNKLHHSEEAWKKNNQKGGVHLPGFQRAWTGKEKLEESDLLSWSDFKMLNKKWHKKLAGVRIFL